MKLNFLNFLLKFLNDESGSLSLTGGGDGGGSDGPPADGGGDSELPPAAGSEQSSGDPEPKLTPPSEPPQVSFPDGLDDDIKNDPSLKVFVDNEGKVNYANVLKSYVHAQRKMGDKGIQLPNKSSTPEDWQNFHNLLRDPDIEKYELKNSLPEGQTLDEDMFNNFKAVAHESGLTTDQAQKVLDWYNSKSHEAQSQISEQQQQAYDKEVKLLKEDWGEAFPREMGLAQRAIKEFADEATVKALKDSGLDSNISLIRLFNKIGHGLMEDKFDVESHGNFGISKQEAQKKIDAIMGDPKHAYWDKDHAYHKHAVEEMSKLTEATIAS